MTKGGLSTWPGWSSGDGCAGDIFRGNIKIALKLDEYGYCHWEDDEDYTSSINWQT